MLLILFEFNLLAVAIRIKRTVWTFKADDVGAILCGRKCIAYCFPTVQCTCFCLIHSDCRISSSDDQPELCLFILLRIFVILWHITCQGEGHSLILFTRIHIWLISCGICLRSTPCFIKNRYTIVNGLYCNIIVAVCRNCISYIRLFCSKSIVSVSCCHVKRFLFCVSAIERYGIYHFNFQSVCLFCSFCNFYNNSVARIQFCILCTCHCCIRL